VKRRALVVFTDGESQPISGVLSSDFARKPLVHVTFVRVGGTSERIYTSGVAEARYKPDPTSSATLTAAAGAVHGRIVDEGDVGNVSAAFATPSAAGRRSTAASKAAAGRSCLSSRSWRSSRSASLLLRRNA
jgi:hypothetical protein